MKGIASTFGRKLVVLVSNLVLTFMLMRLQHPTLVIILFAPHNVSPQVAVAQVMPHVAHSYRKVECGK